MEPTYEPPSTRALLDNAAWVQRLASRLIADELPVVEFRREGRRLEQAFIDTLNKNEKKNGRVS